jgi:hypothetical protein
MNNTYLITRPEHDDTTYYLSNWSKETIELANKKGIKTLDLNKKRANRKEFEDMVKKMSPAFIVLNGHGDENTVMGHENKPIITLGENEGLLKSRIVYAISCRSAINLGRESIKAGTTSYTGYDDDFIFFYDPSKITRPLQDETARKFLEPSKLFITSVIKGNSIAESREKTERLLKENMIKCFNNPLETNMAKFLWWDTQHLVSHGDTNARF